MTELKVNIDGDILKVTVDRAADGTIHAIVGDRSYKLTAVASEPGIYWLAIGERSVEAVVMPSGDGYSVTIGRKRFHVGIEDARAALRRTGLRGHDGTAEIRAPMPGKVVRVLAAEGDEVQANQGIVVMEAMKMQNAIKTPRAGAVKKLCVAEGTAVNAGDLLATVE